MRSVRLAVSLSLIEVLVIALPSSAAGTSPCRQLEDFFNKATTVLSEARDANQAEREIRRLAHRVFDVAGAAQRVLEPEWSVLSVRERREFMRLFGDRVLRTYLGIVRGLLPRDRLPDIRVVGEELLPGGRAALVRTRFRAKDGAERRFDYRMIQAGGSWLVQDVVIDGVSLIENYRAQVAQVLRESSYFQLMARLTPGAVAPPERPPLPQLAAPLKAETP